MAGFPFKPDRNDYPDSSMGEEGGKEYFRSLIRYTFWLILIFVFIFGVSFVFFLRDNPSHQMIDLRGRNVLEAVNWLQDRSLKPFISERIDPMIPLYQVIEQSPAPGTTVKENRTVSLVVSHGGNRLIMPSYRGTNYNQAYQSLLVHLSGYASVPQITKVEKYSDLEEGLVVDHYPRYNQPINFQERFIFVVSRGVVTDKIITKDYLNQDYLEVEAKLLSYGIQVSAEYIASEEKTLAGKIVEQSVTSGTKILPGSSIQFKVGFYDAQVAKTLEAGNSKVEVLRLYKFRVPIQSDWDEFIDNLENSQEVYFSPSNQGADFSGKPLSVLIEITDQTGKRVLLNDYFKSGEEVNFPYRSLGKGSLRVFIDGEIFDTVSFN